MGTPAEAALDAAAPLVECAEKTEVSIPASFSWSFIHRPTVELVSGLCGLVEQIRSCFSLWDDLKGMVSSKYVRRQVSGQIALFGVHSLTE